MVRAIRNAKRVNVSNQMSIWAQLNFHMEPSYPDTTSCERGRTPNVLECQDFSNRLMQSWQPPVEPAFEVVNRSGWIFGCMLDLGSGGWKVVYNSNADGEKKFSMLRVRVCDSRATEQTHFYEMGPLGRPNCGYPMRLYRSECVVAAMQALINDGHGYAKILAQKHLRGDSHPVGCFVRPSGRRAGGDDNMWTISYKEPPLHAQDVVVYDYTGWQPICASALHSSRQHGATMVETAAANASTGGCGDSVRYAYCQGTGCYNCGVRRRQSCRWYYDSLCCYAPVCQARRPKPA